MAFPKCWGRGYIECNDECSFEYSCRLKYQEEIAIPRLNKEMTKTEMQDCENAEVEQK